MLCKGTLFASKNIIFTWKTIFFCGEIRAADDNNPYFVMSGWHFGVCANQFYYFLKC